MKIYFSADYHLDHANIIKYANRPFIHKGDLNEDETWVSQEIKDKRKQEMNLTITKNHNKRLDDEDLLYHVGDFCFGNSAKYWENQLNGDIVHILGNHDKNNGVKTYITHAIMKFGGNVVYVVHRPPKNEQMETLESHIISMCDFIICGHIHNLWKHKKIEVWSHGCRVEKLAINVGIDVWNYEPVSIISILKYISKVNRGLIK